MEQMRWRHLLPPPPPNTQPYPIVLPSPQYSLLHVCSFILLLSNFPPHLALIFLSTFLLWALSHLWFYPPSPPSPDLSILFCFSPSPTFSLFFALFSPPGNSGQLVCLAADCTHTRPNVETDTPPRGALDFVLPCCGTDLLTKVWGCLCVSCQSVHSAERVNFWWNLCRT